MSMNAEDIKAVVIYRKEKAYVTLREAEDMIATEHWNLAMQRLYYACFYMASALLISAGIKAHTHNGVIGQLGLNYVSKGHLTKEEGRFCILVCYRIGLLEIIMIFSISKAKTCCLL